MLPLMLAAKLGICKRLPGGTGLEGTKGPRRGHEEQLGLGTLKGREKPFMNVQPH